ncbi:[FeFe] hydrogenase H-cluster radical SAM maturase HydG [Acetivibrio mesophilus]|uniref:[FeFe] hydrogenase H-cluster radical SAM maturase HydG n=1 Tax=Acetivibrio mesophilus TaxID=2487273 RepID=A0A4Q0I8S2_9FIRM|nr:[FeFe] hydrogenase H-cluster radical SAM maturase HydG [Acetivibrio mesophilus]ODM28050.1 [FeFe] hydrogenase H-cluster radical SAM maturase HydG [Clostridium sp. Bc-iso-3]RXE60345.1 [FeFe] hydrogenase H-cluster radical SAM maturase HydG [Acetivibrio mesophilus]HHV29126.1 [FeFe] hydrogenase H-cluster radical SAM maturase HydG [Clostridium sp.]
MIEKVNFIKEDQIFSLLEKGKITDKNEIREILAKARDCRGINLEEVAKLLYLEDEELLNELYDAAKYIKDRIYGKRVVLFAPLYTSNECTNNCLYCGFRHDNKELHRRTLSLEEIVNEAKALERQGHKRLLLICGEDPRKTNVKHFTDAMDAIYKATDIRRINIEAAPMTVEDYKELKKAGIGTYVIFQETYHRETYKIMHPVGMKANYDWRITAIDRAFEAGIDDVGVGALLGLYNYRFEVLGLLMHCMHFEEKFGVGPHTISVPRLRPALGGALKEVPYNVSDKDFKKIVAIFRIAVPYTGIILSTRERAEFRDELLSVGISQISAGSKTNPGGYEEDDDHADQFEISDNRSLPKMMETICQKGYIPSFCTACYRRCRTGENFMEYAKAGDIHEFCQPNAILTFKENLMDYADESLRKMGEEIILKALEEIDDDKMRTLTIAKLDEIEKGKRDLYF